MPEGDTVFITARRLDKALAGRALTRFELRVPQLALADETGSLVTQVFPVGKHLLMRMSSGRTLRSHLRIDGNWLVGSASRPPRGGPAHAIRAVVGNIEWLASGVRVHDLALVDTTMEHTLVGHLGPDLLDPNFDRAEALRRLAAQPARPVGDTLLDQRLVAGIGNVYKSELLFLHRVNPWAPVGSVDSLGDLLDDAVRLMKANIDHYDRSTTGSREPGRRLWVYGRAGRPCPRCGTPVRLAEQGDATMERILYFCPSCQAER
jgi:formamidopyrimidine-DNA glycosylase